MVSWAGNPFSLEENKTMGPLGWEETVFIFVFALLIFGPKKLPELGRTIGKAMTEFRRASSDLKSSFDREMKSLEQETESLKEVTAQYQYDTNNYDYSSYETNYEGSYGYDHDSTATSSSTESASATEGADSPSEATPEGAIAHGSEIVSMNGTGEHSNDTPHPDRKEEPIPAATEQHT
jgi:TatA/E family protein of Tat protein translocase